MMNATENKQTAPANRVLSGDFQSPAEVLAADHLREDQKREILETWLAEADRRGRENGDIQSLRASILDALNSISD